MDEQNIKELLKETTEVIFDSMVFIKVKGVEPESGTGKIPTQLTAMVGFAGAYMGLAAIHVRNSFAKKIASAMTGIEAEKLTSEDVRDALGEIANMIAGRFKSQLSLKLNLRDQVFEQSVPSVISGEDFETHAVTDAPSYMVAFNADSEIFYVEMAMKAVM